MRFPLSSCCRRGAAFTLVELLVVIGVIAVLVSLLLPTLRGARDQAASIDCSARLRELYFAQTQHALDHRGKFVGLSQTSDARWEVKLAPYVSGASDPRTLARIFRCPAVEEAPKQATSTYGLNSFIMLADWRMRRDAKMPSSSIVLFGDKSAYALDDFLMTDDGWFLVSPGESGILFRSLDHSSHAVYRHSKYGRTNAVMTDGHVQTIARDGLRRDSGHWYWQEPIGLRESAVSIGNCCP